MSYNADLWEKILETGKEKEKGITNKLTGDGLEAILATMMQFNASEIWLQQTYWDLKTAKYKVYDWLAMCVMSRNDDDRERNNIPLKILVNSYLKAEGDVEKFIEDLRYSDYDEDESWQKIEIDK